MDIGILLQVKSQKFGARVRPTLEVCAPKIPPLKFWARARPILGSVPPNAPKIAPKFGTRARSALGVYAPCPHNSPGAYLEPRYLEPLLLERWQTIFFRSTCDTIRCDNVYLTCSRKLTGSH